MISFRFYLVTLVAIFLAVALGVAIGSTFAEPRLIENLRNQIDTVENNLDERVARIDELGSDIDDLETYVDQSAPFAVENRLADQRVLVLAEDGVGDDDVERVVGRLRQGGADTEGVLWLEPAWATGEGASSVASELGIDSDDPEEVSTLALDALVELARPSEDGSGGTDSTTTTTAEPAGSPDSTEPAEATTVPSTDAPTTAAPETTSTTAVPVLTSDLVGALDEAGWVRVQTIDPGESDPVVDVDEAPDGLAVVLVSSPGSEIDTDGTDMAAIARQLVNADVATVATEVWVDTVDGDEESPRGSQVLAIRNDPELSTRVATVDDADLVQGQVGIVLALADLIDGVVGHYGYGEGAERVLPPFLGP